PASRPTTSSAPSSAPASQPTPYTSFSEARPKVIAKLAKDKAANEALRIAHEIISALAAPWSKVTTTQQDEAKAAPESEKAADLYPKLVAQFESKYPGAIKYRRLDYLSQQQLAAQPMGSANALPNSDQQIGLAQAAFLVPGLDKPSSDART